MRLTWFHIAGLKAVQRGDILLTSAGFEFDGLPVRDEERDRLDSLWMDDYIDTDTPTPDQPAVVELTDKGWQALAKAEQESKR